jgi:hypothetical protein
MLVLPAFEVKELPAGLLQDGHRKSLWATVQVHIRRIGTLGPRIVFALDKYDHHRPQIQWS